MPTNLKQLSPATKIGLQLLAQKMALAQTQRTLAGGPTTATPTTPTNGSQPMNPDLIRQVLQMIAQRRGMTQGKQPPMPYRPGLPGAPVQAMRDGGGSTNLPNPYIPPDRLPGGEMPA